MTRQPDQSKIYHITPVANLAPIAADGNRVCDRVILTRGGPAQTIGMSGIKRRRIEELDVDRHSGKRVGDQRPFLLLPTLDHAVRYPWWAFSLSNAFPFHLVERIGVRSARVHRMAEAAVGAMA